MKLSEIKNELLQLDKLAFELPDGTLVPEHFHVTEIGKVQKEFVDCGGTLRTETTINFQLWSADDYNHRLHPEKLVHIIDLSQSLLNLPDADVKVEYQGQTIETYDLEFSGTHFLLTSKYTDCLAKSSCGLPEEKPKVRIGAKEAACCEPSTGCC